LIQQFLLNIYNYFNCQKNNKKQKNTKQIQGNVELHELYIFCSLSNNALPICNKNKVKCFDFLLVFINIQTIKYILHCIMSCHK
jgi:hypothetical protein